MKKILATRYLMFFIFGISLCIPQLVNAFPNRLYTSPFKKIFLRAVLDLTNEQIKALDELKAATQAEVEPLEKEPGGIGHAVARSFIS